MVGKTEGNTIVQLNKYPKNEYNVLIPVSSIQALSSLQKVVVNEVTLDTTDPNNSKDIYKEKSSGKYAITKVGAMKLATAANISVIETKKGMTDACQRCIEMAKAVGKAKACGTCPRANDLSYTATVRVPEPGGGFRIVKATKEIECESIRKTMKTDAQYQRFFEHRAAIAESKALMRAIRSALGLPAGYELTELRKPFIIAHIVPNLDAPEIKDAIAGNYLQSMGMLFETPQNAPALQPHENPTTEVTVPDDEPDDYITDEYGPSPSEYDGPVCEECGAIIEETTNSKGKKWSPQDIADYSKRVHGRVLCLECQKMEG